MTFLCLPHGFDSKTGECRSYQINLQQDGESMPVGFLQGDKTLPVDLDKLAQNLTAVMNGNNPIYRFGDAYQMFYEKHASGMTFRFRPQHEEGGVSSVGALLTLFAGVELEIADD